MISTATRIAASACLLLALAACGSSPASNFYRLTPAQVSAIDGQEPSLGIGPIDIPEFLNRNTLVYGGGNRLQIATADRWAEPLEDGIARVVGLNLSQLVNSENLRFFPWSAQQPPQYGVRIRVLDLNADEGQASLIADWVLYRPADGSAIAQRISRLSTPLPSAGPVPPELPPAYSALLYQLSEAIAAAIRADRRGPAGVQSDS